MLHYLDYSNTPPSSRFSSIENFAKRMKLKDHVAFDATQTFLSLRSVASFFYFWGFFLFFFLKVLSPIGIYLVVVRQECRLFWVGQVVLGWGG